MKKILIILFSLIVLIGCGQKNKDEFTLGTYKDRTYINDHFLIETEIPEGFSFLTSEELKNLNEIMLAESPNPEATKYRNMVMNVEHLDGTKLTAFVDTHPTSSKHQLAEANRYLDFLSAQEIAYKHKKSTVEINGLEYLVLELELPFDESQRSYITVKDDKLINIQINYKNVNAETAKTLMALYE